MRLTTFPPIPHNTSAPAADEAIILPFPRPASPSRWRASTKAAQGWRPVLQRFSQFAFVGASGMIVDLGLYGLLLAVLPQTAARAAAIAFAMTWNFVWNRQLTFADAPRQNWRRQYAGYLVSCLVGASVNWWTSLSLGGLFPPLADQPLLAALIGVIAGTVFNFAICSLVVFRSNAKSPPARGNITRPRTPGGNKPFPTPRAKPRLAIRRS